MSHSGFNRYELRTTDMQAARVFYADVVGPHFWNSGVALSPLPERAAAQGAPAHWLGHIGVADVEAAASRAVALGGQQIGTAQRAADGSPRAVLRDPFGAVLALSSASSNTDPGPVAWHVHHSRDEAKAFEFYHALCGWIGTERFDLGAHGVHHNFAWDESGHAVGSMANTARLPHIHTQWLFFFRVPKLESALARVRAGGGLTLEPVKTPSGAMVAPCDDPQRAAFGLYEV